MTRKLLPPLAATTVALTVIAGCSLANNGDLVVDDTHPGMSVMPSKVGELNDLGATSKRAEYRKFYEQQLEWEKCDKFECATVTVPVDWTRPEGDTIDIALLRRKATGPAKRIGSLLYNPGGPGSSGVDIIREQGDHLVTKHVAERYDFVGFDPRGVGESSPIECVTDKKLDEWMAADFRLDTPAGFKKGSDLAMEFAEGCKKGTGDRLGHMDTWSSARDMDIIRAALGEDKLAYLGASYGTLLGATYAGFYPERVGRMVLDGAIDPSNRGRDQIVGQAEGFERAMRQFVKECLEGTKLTCPLKGSVDDGMRQISDLIKKAETEPIPTELDRAVTANMATTGIIAGLYNQDAWPLLADAIDKAQKGNGGLLLFLNDLYSDRSIDGPYRSNLMEAINVINCLDYNSLQTRKEMQKLGEELKKVAPVFGQRMAYSDLACSRMPFGPVRKPGKIAAEGADPILVVGTTGDPATPYKWSESLAEQLSSGTLLTLVGEGHTAYGGPNQCINQAVDKYLLKGKVPEKGTRCE